MGSLVSTVATRIIIRHLNKTFSLQRLHHIRSDPPSNDPAGNGQTIAAYFAPGGQDLFWLSQNIRHNVSQRPDNRLFLPEDFGVRSPNAEARWKYFLTVGNANVLTHVNHTAIITLIFQGLTTLVPTAGGGLKPLYNRIEFDCIDDNQIAGNLGQHVVAADETDDHGTHYLKIVLVTPPMDALIGVAGLQLDPQPGP
jgi:hypothetical protein